MGTDFLRTGPALHIQLMSLPEEVFESEARKPKLDEEIKEQISDGVKAIKSDEETKEQAPKKISEMSEMEKRYMYDSDEYSSDGERDRDYEEYYRQLDESDGFAVSDFPKIDLPGKTIPVSVGSSKLRDYSDLAIALYNKENASCYKLKEVLNATAYLVQGPIYNLSFSASEGDGDSDAKCFRGSVWEDWGDHGNASAIKCYLHQQK